MPKAGGHVHPSPPHGDAPGIGICGYVVRVIDQTRHSPLFDGGSALYQLSS